MLANLIFFSIFLTSQFLCSNQLQPQYFSEFYNNNCACSPQDETCVSYSDISFLENIKTNQFQKYIKQGNTFLKESNITYQAFPVKYSLTEFRGIGVISESPINVTDSFMKIKQSSCIHTKQPHFQNFYFPQQYMLYHKRHVSPNFSNKKKTILSKKHLELIYQLALHYIYQNNTILQPELQLIGKQYTEFIPPLFTLTYYEKKKFVDRLGFLDELNHERKIITESFKFFIKQIQKSWKMEAILSVFHKQSVLTLDEFAFLYTLTKKSFKTSLQFSDKDILIPLHMLIHQTPLISKFSQMQKPRVMSYFKNISKSFHNDANIILYPNQVMQLNTEFFLFSDKKNYEFYLEEAWIPQKNAIECIKVEMLEQKAAKNWNLEGYLQRVLYSNYFFTAIQCVNKKKIRMHHALGMFQNYARSDIEYCKKRIEKQSPNIIQDYKAILKKCPRYKWNTDYWKLPLQNIQNFKFQQQEVQQKLNEYFQLRKTNNLPTQNAQTLLYYSKILYKFVKILENEIEKQQQILDMEE